ncbi:MAG: elongation factor Ts [Halobacteriovoraceae bacterium]|jgi:elongation factor Ts|nr:elongation factor Ts [Halobacteriovoraceae bacterium]MBT5093803.1 elongation factor Ts [Halobacteriovoraceae bacterium]
MSFSASDVKSLREKTGAGMMKCKEALKECQGDMDAAVDYLRTKGLAAAEKKQSRVAAEGIIATASNAKLGVVVEINCETDFVAKGDDFKAFAQSAADYVLSNEPADINVLKDALGSEASELTLKLGEKIDIRRFVAVKSEGGLGIYNHGGKIGVLVEINTTADTTSAEFQELAKDLSMHVAAANPKFVSGDEIDADFKKREADIYAAQLKEQGKPENMIEKIVEGKLRKLATDVCLLEQKFVKNPDLSVKKLVAEVAAKLGADISVKSFHKINLGEGIEKREDNLADEVAKMTGKQ